MNIESIRNKKTASGLIKQFAARHIEAYYCENASQAVEKALELIPRDDTIAFGGSMTLKETGLLDAIRNGGYNLIDREACPPGTDAARMAFSCGTYLMSANAISEDGQIVNIDGNGNRCAALVFGPKSVIIVAGMNKVCKTLEDAMHRARYHAAPINAQRFIDKVTGCRETGNCENCKTTDCICVHTVITRLSRPAGRIKVILVDGNFGF